MTCRALTTVLALIALPMSAMVGLSTIYATDGNVVGRDTTDSQGTTTLYDGDGRVVSRATGNTVIILDDVLGQGFGDRPKWGKRKHAPDQ